MKITIVGAGNGGSTVAADLALKGHEVSLLKTSNSIHNDHFSHIRSNGNEITLIRKRQPQTAQLKLVTQNYDEAFKDCELVILYVQTNFQEDVARKIAPYLMEQMVLLEPGYLGTLLFMKYTGEKPLRFIEAESSPIDCRITRPGEVTVLFENVRNPIGVYPVEQTTTVLEQLSVLDYKFVPKKSVIESALHNPNLIVHTVGAFMSIPRIEYSNGAYSMYREVFTPHVWNIVKQLDEEKMNVLEKLGYERFPYVEACKYRNSADDSTDATVVFFDYARNHSPKGPSIPDSRYLTEDVPEGLVLLESIGAHIGIKTPVCSSLISLSSAALDVDFREQGRTVDRLGRTNFEKLINEHA